MLRLTDFRMAGFLVARGLALSNTKVEGAEVTFIFEDEKGLFSGIFGTEDDK